MTDGTGKHYIRLGATIVDSETTCTPEQCDIAGCVWPECSIEVRQFNAEKDADKYQRELELLGNEVST
jgi:hypothetical protein